MDGESRYGKFDEDNPENENRQENYDTNTCVLPAESLDRQNEKNEDENSDSEEDLPPVPFYSLFKYGSCWDIFLVCLGLVIAVVSGTSIPAVMILFGKIIDKMIIYHLSEKHITNNTMTNDQFLEETAKLCEYYAIFGLSIFVLYYAMVVLLSIAAENQAFRIRSLFMRSLLKQDIGWYDTHRTGDFASRITTDLSRIQDGIGEKLGICVSFMSITVLSLAAGLYYGWKLALVILSVTPVMAIATAIMYKVQANASKEEFEAYGKAGSVAEEVLSAIRTVVAFGGQRKEIERYEKFLLPAKKKGIKRGLMTSIGSAVSWFCVFAGYALAFWYGVKLIVDDKDKENPTYTAGTLIIIFFNVMFGSMFFGMSSPYFEAFAVAKGAASKIFSIIDRNPDIDSSSDEGAILNSVEGCIKLKNVSFSYPSRQTVTVLKDLTLTMDAGQTVALVGASGCGKSTVVQLILRFYDPISGSVELDDRNLKELNVGWLRDHIGLVGQEPVLFSTTIEDNIRHGKLDATEEEVKNAAKLANVHDFIENLPLKYKTEVGGRGTQLSGGQKQRIAIARALVKNPKILLLDEATSALDTESEAVVQVALDEARRGRTTVIVAHRLSTIRSADKIVVLENGAIKETGTHDELMDLRGSYYDLVHSQMQNISKEDDNDLNDDDNGKNALMNSSSANTIHSSEGIQRQTSVSSNQSIRRVSVCNSMIHRQMSCAGSIERQVSSVDEKIRDIPEEEEDASSITQMQLFKMAAPEWGYIVIAVFCAAIMGLHLPAYGIVFGSIIGALSEDPESIQKKNAIFCIIFLGLAITSFVATFIEIFLFSLAGEKLTCRLRKLSFANIVTQDMSFFDDPKNSVGSLCSRLTSDAANIQGASGDRIGMIFKAMSTVVAATGLAFAYNLKLAGLTVVFIPLIIAAFFIENHVVKSHMEAERISTEEASKIAVESIENIRTVASLHREQMFYDQFQSALLETHKGSRLKCHIRGLSFGFAQSIPSLGYAACFYYGSILVGHGELEYGDLLKVVEGVLASASVVGQAVAFTSDYQKAKVGAIRILKLLQCKPKINAFSDQGIIKEYSKGHIQFQNTHFSYPNRDKVKVLRGLQMEIEPGKSVALVGSSGCGKSTCVQLIERFYDVQQGRLLIDSDDIRDLNVANHRSHIGLVSQEPVLFSYSIAENIAYGDNTRDVGMDEIMEAARQANIHNFIASLPQGYNTPVGDKGAQLSGGQKQRVAVARALLRSPKILLLDEATSALDAESEKIVQEALDRAKTGRTCLTIAHRLTAVQNADCIMVIHKGRIVEKGTHQELMSKKGHYYNLYNIQMPVQ